MIGKQLLELGPSFVPKKCGRRLKRVDRISQLPDDILVHILSFLPLRKSIATSVLSPRWLHLWKYTPKLKFAFDSGSSSTLTIPKCVNSVLDSHKTPSLKVFSICFYVEDDPLYYQSLTKCLHFAFSRRVESLRLYFNHSDIILDTDILSFINQPSNDYKFHFLKELKLGGLNVSGEAIELFLCNCPLLERLRLNAFITSDLHIVVGNLKYLKLRNSEIEKSIKVSAPNLTQLECNLPLEKVFLDHVPNLVHASFNLLYGDTMQHFAKEAQKLEVLSIRVTNPVAFPVPQMPKLNKLVLEYVHCDYDSLLLPVTHLLQASPCLREFRLKFRDVGLRKVVSPAGSLFEIPKLGTYDEHDRLKVFEFLGFGSGIVDHMGLLTYIVGNCVALEKLTIIPLSSLSYRIWLCPNLIPSEERVATALNNKKSKEQEIADKIPHHIKLCVHH